MLWKLLLLGSLLHISPSSGIDSVEKELYDYLFTNYTRDLRPLATDFFAKVKVTVQFVVSQLEQLNEKDQVLTSHGTISMFWTDELLTWNPEDFNGAHYLIVPASKVWLPELSAVNSVIDADELAFDQANQRVRIFSQGLVIWAPKMRWKTTCPIDITYFPYDKQECQIVYVSEVYTNSMIDFTLFDKVLLANLTPTTGWNMTETKTHYSLYVDEYYSYPVLSLSISLERKSKYFEVNIILPALLLSLLLIPMFIMPADAGEKVSLGVTLMLAYSIFLLMLAEYTPQSGTIPNLSVVLVVCIVFSGLGMFLNVIIINIHYHMPDKTVPKWVKKVFLEIIGTTICRMRYYEEDKASPKVEPILVETEFAEELKKLPLTKKASMNEMEQLLAYLDFFKAKRLDDDQVDQVKEEWNKVARVLDRILLIVYMILFIVFLFVTLSYKWKAP